MGVTIQDPNATGLQDSSNLARLHAWSKPGGRINGNRIGEHFVGAVIRQRDRQVIADQELVPGDGKLLERLPRATGGPTWL
jgi:hypothetical protein